MNKILFLFALVILAGVFSINDAFAFKTISNDSTGGDCSTIGTWNSATKTCTLTSDFTSDTSDGIKIASNGITLDGNSHTIAGNFNLVGTTFSGTLYGGVHLGGTSGVTVKSLNIKNFGVGIVLADTGSHTIIDNTIESNYYGLQIASSNGNTVTDNTVSNSNSYAIFLSSSSSNKIYNNNLLSNVHPTVLVSGGSGNVYNLPAPIGGNYWSKYTCYNPDGDNFCDPRPFGVSSSGVWEYDNLPWAKQNGWIVTPPLPPVVTPSDGPFVLPCSMQEKGDGVSASSCYGFYQNSIARAEVGIKYNTGLFPIINYKAVGYFIDTNGNQGQNITVTLDKINPGESKTLVFTNPTTGFVSEFKMQMLGGTLVTKTPDTIPPVVVVPNNMAIQATSNNPSPVTFSVSATDETDGPITPTCSPKSGTSFAIGKTTVTCTATDKAGNTATKSFTITVTNRPLA